MTLSGIAVKRPVFTVMMAVCMIVLGGMGFFSLGTDLFPDVAIPVVTVVVPYPGANPAEVETLVSRPIEDAVIGINGIDRVRSFSREGVSTTIIMFLLGVDTADAATQVRERVAGARRKLPDDVKDPTIARFDISAAPVVTYTLSSKISLSRARKYAEDVIKPSLEQLPGVAQVNVNGGLAREIRVSLKRAQIDALKLDPAMIVSKLRAANLNVPAGHYDEGAREVSVRTNGEFDSVESIRNLIIATSADGSTVRLRDIAEVEDGFEDATTMIRSNGADTVSLEVVKQSGANTVAVVDASQARLSKLEKAFPDDIARAKIIDQSTAVRANIREVETSIVYGGAMAILIILIFMLDMRSTLISAVALPTSVIGTFFFMYMFGYSLNMMTLLALSLAIGLLIDDAVVVRENIFKHLERGKSPMQAALDGTSEITLSVLATTLTIIAVFLPVAFMRGMVGQFFRQFGVTISVATALSMFVAFTIDPMLSSRFSKKMGAGEKEGFTWLKRPFRWFFSGIDSIYQVMLHWVVTHKWLTVGAAILTTVGTVFLAGLAGFEFMPAQDHAQYGVDIEFPAGTSLAETSRRSLALENELLKDKEIVTVYSTIAPDQEANKARWRVVTTDKEKRTVSMFALQDRARSLFKNIPDAKVSISDPPMIEGTGNSQIPIQIDVRGNTYDDIYPIAQQIAGYLKNTQGVQDVKVNFTPGRPELQLEIDRQKAADLGIFVSTIAMNMRTAMEGEEAGNYRDGKDEIPIRVRMDEKNRASEGELGQLQLTTQKGPIPLKDIARFVRKEGPQVIEREARARQILVTASITGSRSLGDIVNDVVPKVEAIKLPNGASLYYDSAIKMMRETNQNMGLAMLLGLVFVYMVLASQFESFIHPLTIMVTVPLAIVGAIMGLFLSHNTIAMGSMIGMILLVGLVTKNAILLIDRAIVRVRDKGETPIQAVLEAGPERLRPILMTSAAMVLGMLPTAIGAGEGSEFRAPMAIAVIGGVISSTFLSLLVVPAIYVLIENLFPHKKQKLQATIEQAPIAAE